MRLKISGPSLEEYQVLQMQKAGMNFKNIKRARKICRLKSVLRKLKIGKTSSIDEQANVMVAEQYLKKNIAALQKLQEANLNTQVIILT